MMNLDNVVTDMESLRALTKAALALSKVGLDDGDLATNLLHLVAVIDGKAADTQRALYVAVDDFERERMGW